MMAVSIRFFANVKTFMGKGEVLLHLVPSRQYSIRDILKEIEKSEKKDLFPLVFRSHEVPLRAVRVVLNGKMIHSVESNETIVEDGDRISLFPLLAGG